jgi:hypothetical protein
MTTCVCSSGSPARDVRWGERGRHEPIRPHLADAVLPSPAAGRTRLLLEVAERLPPRRVVRRPRLRGDAFVAKRPQQAHALRRLKRQIECRHATLPHDAPQLAAGDRVAAAQQRREPVLVH